MLRPARAYHYRMRRMRPDPPCLVALLICSASAVASAGLAAAQQYPVRPIRVIVPYPPGGPNEVITRGIGEHGTAFSCQAEPRRQS
jgi:hypothetical protein